MKRFEKTREEFIRLLREELPMCDIYEDIVPINDNDTECFIIRTSNKECLPTIRVDEVIEKIMGGIKMKEVAEEYARIVETLVNKVGIDIRHYDSISEHLTFRLVDTTREEELNEQCFSIPFLDLHVIFEVAIIDEEHAMACNVSEEIAEKWGKTAEELLAKATDNMCIRYPAVLMTSEDIFIGAGDKDISDFYIVTNQTQYGLSCILYPNLLKSISDEIGDFFIVPSTLQEALILPKQRHPDINRVKEQVQQSNLWIMENDPDLLFKDSLYFYSRSNGEVSIVK